MQIIVLGMHRSGTSLVTRLINMMGAYFGPERISLGFNSDNPKGFWERRDVVGLNEAILRTHGCEWYRLAAWPSPLPALNAQSEDAIRQIVLGMDAFRPWVMKDPRQCLTLPYWLPVLEVPVAVIVHRDPLEVVQSLATRNEIAPAHSLALWEYHVVSLLNATQGMPRIFVSHRDAIADPVGFVSQMHNALVAEEVRGLHLPAPHEILGFIDKKLHRAHAGASMKLSPALQQLCSIMQGLQPQEGTLSISQESIAAMQKHQSAQIKHR